MDGLRENFDRDGDGAGLRHKLPVFSDEPAAVSGGDDELLAEEAAAAPLDDVAVGADFIRAVKAPVRFGGVQRRQRDAHGGAGKRNFGCGRNHGDAETFRFDAAAELTEPDKRGRARADADDLTVLRFGDDLPCAALFGFQVADFTAPAVAVQ